jgi:hypothetical protein
MAGTEHSAEHAPSWHLAQINIGRIVAPLDDPVMREFVENLDRINALAEASPGFVWRFQTASGNATDERPYDDDRILINFSVWEDIASLRAFTYRGDHAAIMRKRRQWFEHMQEAYQALWWVPAGPHPTVREATSRIECIRAHGPTPEAFTFHQAFLPPGSSGVSTGQDRGFSTR